jgi:hypothetical protein
MNAFRFQPIIVIPKMEGIQLRWKIVNFINCGLTAVYAIYSIVNPQQVLQILKTDSQFMNPYSEFQRSMIGILSLQLAALYYYFARENSLIYIQRFAKFLFFSFLSLLIWFGYNFVYDTHGLFHSIKNTALSWVVFCLAYAYFAFSSFQDEIEKDD